MPISSLVEGEVEFEIVVEVGVEVEVEVGVEVGVEVRVEVGVRGDQGWAWAYFSGRVGGWLEIWRVKLISTQVVVEVEVGVELGNT